MWVSTEITMRTPQPLHFLGLSALLSLPLSACFQETSPPMSDTTETSETGEPTGDGDGDLTGDGDGDPTGDGDGDPTGDGDGDPTGDGDGDPTGDGDGDPTGDGDGDPASGAECGDGIAERGEACDGNDLLGADCGDLGFFPDAALSCTPDCTYDTSQCVAGKLVFLSEAVLVGAEIGSVANADMVCQQEADAQGLGGTYKAWISDANTSPSQSFTQSQDPYRLINGDVVATNWADLTDGELPTNARIAVTAAGQGVGGDAPGDCRVWTGTLANGTLDVDYGHCDNWSDPALPGTIGFWDSPNGGGQCDSNVPSQWSGGDAANLCESARRLYCFQQ